MASRPRVFNIPASAEFLPVLIRALVDDRLALGFKPGDDPLALAGVTIYLPTRRACRLAQKRFLDVLGRDAAILPRIVPIGDIDADEIDFAEAAAGTTAEPALELPEALGGLERKMLLAELILKWADTSEMRRDGGSLVANSPASALALAGDLARLMDDMVTRQVPWSKLDTLVPEEHDEFWQKTLRFLRIARDYWPAALTERGKIDPADRRNRLIDAEAARLQKHDGPVIAAGSTGSIPATATLLATIARLPRGAVVLPGLDTDLDAATWDIIAKDGDVEAAHGHPQFAMQALLQKIGIAREEVAALAEPKSHGRERIASEALRPAAASELWQQRLTEKAFAAHADAALDKLSVIEAANAEEEALAIAVALREAVETPDKTAALVTPDRALARRVLAALKRWQVPVDDSGGDVLPDTPAGVFAQLAAEAAIEGLPPVTLLAQALATFAAELGKFWRGEPSSLHRSEPRAEIHEGELAEATALAAELKAAFAPLEDLPQHPHRIADLAGRHAQVVQALGTMTEELAAAFDEINATGSLEIKPGDYPELFHAAIADRQVRRPERDVRVRIYGPLEARLQTVDRLVLGGLVEGVWPPQTPVDPWLSRPMRHQLGLDLPERRIGLSAHDFAQALGAREVVLSRAAKLSGAPTVASRFVQRLAAVAGKDRWEAALKQGAVYADYARTLDAPGKRAQPVSRPEPKPPREVRPSALSVTEIELWLRDPYSIYARHILRLRPLDEIDTPPGARDRGTVVHGAIGDFTAKFKDRLPDDIVDELLKLGRQHFAALEEFPDAKAFWWPRFLRVANWFADFEAKRRVGIAKIEAEIRGTVEIPLKERVFTLSARADRIEKRIDGKYAIVDYKTGRTSSAKEVRTGLAPQLTLEAAILRAGRFGEIASGASIAELLYVSLRGVNPPGELRPIQWDDTDPDTQADTALKRLTSVVTKFDDPDTPYRSRERPMFMRRNPGYYDHLARVKEWSLSGGADDDAEAGNE
jgi:ATP-dependent helicase/nuclease subunit B